MAYLRQRSKLLTTYLEGLIRNTFVERKKVNLDILTPTNPDERGAQLSIRFAQNVRKVHSELEKRGIVVSVFINFSLNSLVLILKKIFI